jgi:hypothetical protein
MASLVWESVHNRKLISARPLFSFSPQEDEIGEKELGVKMQHNYLGMYI